MPYELPSQADSQRISQTAEHLIRAVRLFGYDMVETGLIQPAELFMTRAGDEIADHLFTFERGGQTLVLRPEFTSAALQHYVNTFPDAVEVRRWAYHGPIFNDADDGSPYQQTSVGAEFLGMGNSFADAEVLALGLQAINQLGIADAKLVIGSVALTRQSIAQFGLDSRAQQLLMSHLHQVEHAPQTTDALSSWLSKLLQTSLDDAVNSELTSSPDQTARTLQTLLGSQQSTAMGGRTREEILARLLQKRQRAASHAEYRQLVTFLSQWMSVSCSLDEAESVITGYLGSRAGDFAETVNRFLDPIRMLSDYGVSPEQIIVKPALSRNWEYYSGVVFEIQTADGDVLAAGGRYDTFATLLGASGSVPAIGIAFFVDTVTGHASIEERPIAQPITLIAQPLHNAIRPAAALRASGLDVRITETAPSDSTHLVVVGADSNLTFNHQIFPLERIGDLASALKKGQA